MLQTRANIDHICLSQAISDGVKNVGAWEAGEDNNGKPISDHNGVWVDYVNACVAD
jgi:exonuclease III